ncbi:protein of unknown function [Acidithiobacillus ferrivorans]|uniref:Uncharacterized protein n=1 Tax=Acidithiobacillus ferrivorans TaxID=160808 RepID=A0A060USA9_9PROT|nr:hypothetical protein AFERRI_530210 [Acidithiobacillus ferrivorans]SMH67675.1 protein of unknown function [Acidithiobacillus ferrivorans]
MRSFGYCVPVQQGMQKPIMPCMAWLSELHYASDMKSRQAREIVMATVRHTGQPANTGMVSHDFLSDIGTLSYRLGIFIINGLCIDGLRSARQQSTFCLTPSLAHQ